MSPKHALPQWLSRKKLPAKPPAPAATLSADDTPLQSGNKSEWVINGITLALDLAKQALDIAGVAPFIGPGAELLGKIIDSYKARPGYQSSWPTHYLFFQEFKDVDEKHDLLAQRITDVTGDICATVLRMQETNYSNQIGRLKQDLEKYAKLIDTASQFIKKYDNQGSITHFLGQDPIQDEMDKLQQDLDLFGARFGNNRLVDLCLQQSTNTQTLEKVYDAVTAVTKEKLEKWLQFPPEMGPKQLETAKLHSEGTGEWFLEDKRFIEWEDYPGVLWVEGPSGAGKSVISSMIIKKLFGMQAQSAPHLFAVAFFYFDFRRKETQSVDVALRRFILQLSEHVPQPFKTLDDHYKLSAGQNPPDSEKLINLVSELLQQLGRTYIVLDALDECDSNSFKQLVGLVANLKAWTRTPLHVFITSQPRDEFTQGFKGITQIALKGKPVDKDIEFFITVKLDDPRLKQWKRHSDQVTKKVTEKAGGI
ncbi:Pfs domain-containing protein [Mycena sanguinolenta]|uniref:Pfs domain-containing protein n=1 Tax=Mycena sanguinolenta TaxID=230812 RepID=A0A8H6XYM3_9AGAR|nr:Pfs domain-containing protein [Mycena sanguinolenta]